MNHKSHLGLWLALVVVIFLLTPVMKNGAAMESFVRHELEVTKLTFGAKTGAWIEQKADVVFRFYTPAASVKTAAVDREGLDRTRRVVSGPGVALFKNFNAYIYGLVLNMFVAVMRMFIFAVWLLVLCPVFVAAVIDGFVQRSIKRAEFGAIRPAAHSVAKFIVIPLFVAPILYFVLPLPISPLSSPMWALIMVLPLSALVSNTQPIFGRS